MKQVYKLRCANASRHVMLSLRVLVGGIISNEFYIKIAFEL